MSKFNLYKTIEEISKRGWESPFTRPAFHDPNNYEIIKWYGDGPNEYGVQMADVKCSGPPGSSKCCGTYKDPTGDGHGGLNGGVLVKCGVCQGRGNISLWMKV